VTAKTLLQITIGPVQDFIAASRRTRDLWFGSHILSEISKAAARALALDDLDASPIASLIFPALARGDNELEPRHDALNIHEKPAFNVANIVLATLNTRDEAKIRRIAAAARNAALAEWRGYADRAWQVACAIIDPAQRQAWDEQVATFLEIGAVWIGYDPDVEDAYRDARKALARAQAARKNLRDFSQWDKASGPLPKSSLDGQRATVLKLHPNDAEWRELYRLRINATQGPRGTRGGEELDAIGVIKRVGGRDQGFIPLSNITYAHWLRSIPQRDRDKISDAITHALPDAQISSRRPRSSRVADLLNADAHALILERQPSLLESYGYPKDTDRLAEVNALIGSQPKHSYVACLVADGDRMGKALDALGSDTAHQHASRAIAAFAHKDARRIVEQDYFGQLVYAGGDDVLAFVALEDAVACANALRLAFAKRAEAAFKEAFKSIQDPPLIPTLSVGLGIGHVMESMGYLLELGRRAEKDAKRLRDALAIIFDKRSGDTLTWRAGWSSDPLTTLRDARSAIDSGAISTAKLYELAALLRTMPAAHAPLDDDAAWLRLLTHDFRRCLVRTNRGLAASAALDPALDPTHASYSSYGALREALDAWIAMMLIARNIPTIHDAPQP
jgi:CRISPR-associated protein Cmr2